ncbi:MAG: HlyD family efflux transporter periplasmic adaptor subunit [Clostridiales bacterium]|nr:HlyD family efflux transporter periplasmic adaptor subunit [Clostridiales bacterium]
MKMSKGARIATYIFLIVVLGLAVVIYVLPSVTDFLAETSIIEYGQLQRTTETEAWFIREERTIQAPAAGSAQYYFEEGERVRKGSRLLEVFPGNYTYKSEGSGLVSYWMDGLETTLTPETMLTVSREYLEDWKGSPIQVQQESVTAGQSVMKVVDSDEWRLLYWVTDSQVTAYNKGSSVTVSLPLGDVTATVESITDDGEDSWRIVLRSNRYYEEMQKLRNTPVTVVTSDKKGLVIKNSAITTLDGDVGVYVKQVNGDFEFVPISVLGTDGNISIVAAGSFNKKQPDGTTKAVTTVSAFDEILNQPPVK